MRFRGLVALAATLVVALGLVTPAFAATITVNQSESGHKYKAYQVLDATVSEESGHMNVQLSDVQWGKDIDGDKLLRVLKSHNEQNNAVGDTQVYAATTKGGTKSNVALKTLYANCNSAADFAAIFDWASDNTALADTIGQIINTKSNDIIKSGANPIESMGVAGSGSTAGHYTLTIDDPGYYFIGDGDSTGTTLYTDHFFLQIFNDDKTVAPKASTPSMEKKVYENTKYHNATNNDYGTGFNDTADYSIGDYVPFKLIGTIPEMSAYNNGYQYQFNDTLSVSLTRPTGMYKATGNVNGPRVYLAKNKDDVTIDAATGDFTTVAANVKDVTSSFSFTTGSDNDMTIAVNIEGSTSPAGTNDLTQLDGIYNKDGSGNVITNQDGSKQRSDYNYIIVVYKAQLNEQAAIGQETIQNNTLGTQHKTNSPNVGNVNAACIEYSNNPNTPSTHGDTDDDYVIVFTYEVDLTKASASDVSTKLGGATFYLLNSDQTKVAVLDSHHKFKRWADYQQYQTGSLSTLQTNGTTETLETGETTTLTSANNTGFFSVIGLDDGTYTLREVTPPTGYNTAQADWTIVVSADTSNGQQGNGAESELKSIATVLTGGSKAVKYGTASLVGTAQDLVVDSSVTSDLSTGKLTATITNTQGFQLPQTGGLGTMILTIAGVALVAGAILILTIRKRANDEQ